MRSLWWLGLVALAACAPRAAHPDIGSAAVTGVIQLPPGVSPSQACRGMSLEAVIPEGHSVGDVHLRPSEQRCSYEILNLPADTALEVRIHSSGWACTDGTAPGFAPDHETLQLARSETRLIDFASTCGGNPG